MTTRTITYLAHQLSAPDQAGVDTNIDEAEAWCAWLSEQLPIAPVCTWITLVRRWPDSGELRRMGLEIDVRLVSACQVFIAVGPKWSTGMLIEKAEAERLGIPVWGFTGRERGEELRREIATRLRKFGEVAA